MNAHPTLAQPTRVKRVDGSTITPAEIERTVTRLMTVAKVPGMSITKGVFAYFVMQLVDQHIIELDTPIAN